MKYRVGRFAEKLFMEIVWHLPKPVIKWAAVRLFANASRVLPDRAMGDISLIDALNSW